MAERLPVAVPRACKSLQFGGLVAASTNSDSTEWGDVMTWPSPLQHLFERLKGSPRAFADIVIHEDREKINVLLDHYVQHANVIEERLRMVASVRMERERGE